MDLESPRIRVLVALVDERGQLKRTALLAEEDLPLPWPYIIIGRDPEDTRKFKTTLKPKK